MAKVQLRLGDMFDGPTDLIVLPCSTSGTITPFVRAKLVHHRIPYPQSDMKLGDVSILPFDGGENIAQFVAFAASVEFNTSSAAAVRRIGQQLGEFTHEGAGVRHIAAPLLGAGAGGLEPDEVVEALSAGFKETAQRDATLIINVLKRDAFDRINTKLRSLTGNTQDLTAVNKSLRVFISYSHSSSQHEQWVKELATFLRANGVDARLDIWHLRRGMDLPQWMTNELTLADRIVLVSDERYAEKADGRVGGVGWETMIVQGDISRQPPDSIKYLVLVRSLDIDRGLPTYLKTKFVIHWPDGAAEESNRSILLSELFDRVSAPPLGTPPLFI